MPSPRRQKTSSPAPAETGRPSRLRRAIGRLPRLETVFLLAAALVTVAAKGVVIRRHGPDEPLAAWLEVIRADLAFFGALALGVALASLLRPGGVLGRLALVVAAATLGWSVVAAAWLYTSGVQLQPGVLALLARNPSGFAPVVTTRLRQDLPLAVPGLLLAALAAAWLVRRLIRPAPPPAVARRAGLAIGAAFVLVAAILATVAGFPRTALGYHREVLGFSSHWYALADVVSRAADDRDVEAPTRRLPRAGARAVAPPPPDAPRPNVVILLLESVSHASASLDGSEPDTTPALRTLAAEGVEIVTTRVPVAYTSKAFWATFTGSTPDVQPDAAESVLADEPYESIAS
ncbi:MAG: sulfatase-like hydrolase/transferase, partial [Planctomycetota bacterium]